MCRATLHWPRCSNQSTIGTVRLLPRPAPPLVSTLILPASPVLRPQAGRSPPMFSPRSQADVNSLQSSLRHQAEVWGAACCYMNSLADLAHIGVGQMGIRPSCLPACVHACVLMVALPWRGACSPSIIPADPLTTLRRPRPAGTRSWQTSRQRSGRHGRRSLGRRPGRRGRMQSGWPPSRRWPLAACPRWGSSISWPAARWHAWARRPAHRRAGQREFQRVGSRGCESGGVGPHWGHTCWLASQRGQLANSAWCASPPALCMAAGRRRAAAVHWLVGAAPAAQPAGGGRQRALPARAGGEHSAGRQAGERAGRQAGRQHDSFHGRRQEDSAALRL